MPPKQHPDLYEMLAAINDRTIRTEEQVKSIKDTQTSRAAQVDTQFFTLDQKLDKQGERINGYSKRIRILEIWQGGVSMCIALISFALSQLKK